jgi:antitoxin CptB
MNEPLDTRLKRLKMRSMRRGIKEMDIILSRFAEECLSQMNQKDLDIYEDFLEQNDQDLYQWVSGQRASAPQFQALVEDIKTHISNTAR